VLQDLKATFQGSAPLTLENTTFGSFASVKEAVALGDSEAQVTWIPSAVSRWSYKALVLCPTQPARAMRLNLRSHATSDIAISTVGSQGVLAHDLIDVVSCQVTTAVFTASFSSPDATSAFAVLSVLTGQQYNTLVKNGKHRSCLG
jgi:hypothetical protein